MFFIKNNYNKNKYPTYNTGPDVISAFIKIYGKKFKIKYCPFLNNGPIVKHHKGGVWREPNMRILKQNCLICNKIPHICKCYYGYWFNYLIII